jgi:hypothetical protein
MTSSRKYAELAMAALDKVLPPGVDSKTAGIVERVFGRGIARAQRRRTERLAEIEAAAEEKLVRLLDASPAHQREYQAATRLLPG